MADRKNGWMTVGHPPTSPENRRVWQAEQESRERTLIESWEQDDQWPAAHKPLFDGPNAKRFDDRLSRLEDLGHGSFGRVEKVSHRSVCLARKRIRQRRGGYTIDELRQEGVTMGKLDHRHVVKLIGLYVLQSRELCLLIWPAAVCTLGDLLEDIERFRLGQGGRDDIIDRFDRLDLQDLSAVEPNPIAQSFDTSARCPLEYLRTVAGCAARALAYCHANHVRHLDIKPSNVLLNPHRVYLADFGVSRDVSNQDHTTTEGQPGTEKWRAPELYIGGGSSMQLSDVYSLGLVYLNMATVLYNGRLEEFDATLRYPPYDTRSEQLARREELLQRYIEHLTPLAHSMSPFWFTYDGQETVKPRPLLKLITLMTSRTPKLRPASNKVDERLSMLGGIHQIYHGDCCKRPASWVEEKWDRKFVVMESLQKENDVQRRKIEELEGRDRMYESRLENERRVHEHHLAVLQKRLGEAEQKCRQMAEDAGRRRSYHKGASQSSLPQGRRSSLNVSARPNGGDGVSGTASGTSGASSSTVKGQQPPATPNRPSLQHKAWSAQQQPPNATSPRPGGPGLRRVTPIARAKTEPVANASLTATNLTGSDPRRGSPLSRIPLPITPTRTGTPVWNRDQSSTDSSFASSVFSRRSVDTTPTPVQSTPNLAQGEDATAVQRRVSVGGKDAEAVGKVLVEFEEVQVPPASPSIASTLGTLDTETGSLSSLLGASAPSQSSSTLASKRISWADVLRKR